MHALVGVGALALLAQAVNQDVAPLPSDDIVVEGLRDLDDPGSLVTRRTLGSGRTGESALQSRRVFELSERYAKCIVGIRSSTRLLRLTLDGNINSARQRFAQSQLARSFSACAADPEIARSFGVATPAMLYDASYYDRGALTLAVLRKYEPKLKLTKAQTSDPVVQQRFNAREIPRAKFRLPVDRRYFEFAICFVRLQPELAVRLTKPGLDNDSVARLEAAIVNGGRACTGSATKVYFDPSQFRFYIADAVYRWTVAAQGIDTLVDYRGGGQPDT